MWESETKQKTIARSLHGYDDGIVKFAPPDTTWVASIFRGHPRGVKKIFQFVFRFPGVNELSHTKGGNSSTKGQSNAARSIGFDFWYLDRKRWWSFQLTSSTLYRKLINRKPCKPHDSLKRCAKGHLSVDSHYPRRLEGRKSFHNQNWKIASRA